ncbi:MAG: hypothetical protein ABIG42_09010 [bacterium]
MNVLYEKSFLRDIEKLRDQSVRDDVTVFIENIKKGDNPMALSNVKKLKGHHAAYRISIGMYRLGFFFENNTAILTRFLHRKDIYKRFP